MLPQMIKGVQRGALPRLRGRRRSAPLEGSRFDLRAMPPLVSSTICASETCGNRRLPGMTSAIFCTVVLLAGYIVFANVWRSQTLSSWREPRAFTFSGLIRNTTKSAWNEPAHSNGSTGADRSRPRKRGSAPRFRNNERSARIIQSGENTSFADRFHARPWNELAGTGDRALRKRAGAGLIAGALYLGRM